MKKKLLIIVLLCTAMGFNNLQAQNIIKTFAGTGAAASNGDAGLATAAGIARPESITINNGFMYVVGNSRVRKIDLSTNIITTLISGLNGPRYIAFDENGRFFLSENTRITRYNADGTGRLLVAGSEVIAATGPPVIVAETGFVDGPTGTSRVNNPRGLAYDPALKFLYIADVNNNAIRKLDCNVPTTATSYNLTTFANTAGTSSNVVVANSAALTTFKQPSAIALTTNGDIYWTTFLAYSIYKSNSDGTVVSTLLPTDTNQNSGDDGLPSVARMGGSTGIAFNANGDLFFSDFNYHRIRKIAIGTGGDGKITAYVGNPSPGSTQVAVTPATTGDGANAIVANTTTTTGTSNIWSPNGLAFGSFNGSGEVLYIAENGTNTNAQGNRIRVVGTAAVLPLTLTSFDADKVNNEVSLKWNTASEDNVKEFVVEKKDDFSDFKAIQTVAAKNVASATYSVADRNITSANNYYRLKMVDIDGTFKYSDVKVVKFASLSQDKISIYPNPVQNILNLNHAEAEQGASISIYNLEGKQVIKKEVTINTIQSNIDTSLLKAGQYVLEFNNNGSKQTIKFIK